MRCGEMTLAYPISKNLLRFRMKNKEIIQSKPLKEGSYLEKEFTSYQEMAEHSPEWSLFCNYQFRSKGMEGAYKVLELPTMQLAHSDIVGGFMFSFEAPKDRICFSIITHVEDKACFEALKLSSGMIVVFDDRRVYNFMSSGAIKIIDVAIKKESDSPLIAMLSKLQEQSFIDTDKRMETLFHKVISCSSACQESIRALQIEEQLTTAMMSLIASQQPQVSKLTKGEKIAIKIRDQVFHHMDGVVTTKILSQQYGVTPATVQNSFKALFGYTPQYFLRLLKLNHVHHELYEYNEGDTTVMRVAQKWGFQHMGRFTGYYKELFDEKPSETLRQEDHEDDGLRTGCVERKEEIRGGE